MAEKSLTFNLFGHDVSASSAVGEFASKAHGHLSGLIGDIAKVAGAFLGIQTVFEFGKSSVEAALTAQTANEKLDVALKNVHSSLTSNSSAVDTQRSKLLDLGFTQATFDDALAKATTGLGSGSKALQIMGVSADLAKFKNIDLASAVLIVQKGMEGQLRPLRQLGIDLPVAAGNAQQVATANKHLADAQQSVNDVLAKYPDAADKASKGHAAYEAAIKKVATAQQSVNDKSSAGQTILDTLSERLKGQAAKAAETYAGKLDVVNAKWDDTKVKIGTVVLPALGNLADFINNGVMPALDKMNKALDKDHGNFLQAFGAGSKSQSGGPFSGPAWQNGAQQMTQGLSGQSYNPAGGNGPFDPKSWQHGMDQIFAAFGNGWNQLMGRIGTVWNKSMGALGGVFASTTNGTMWRSIGDLIGKFGNGWNQLMGKFGNGWAELMGKFGNGWSQIAGAFGNGWAQLMGKFGTGWNQIMTGFGHGWTQIATAFGNGWNQLMTTFTGAWNGLMKGLGNGWSQISTAFTKGWNSLMGSFQNGWQQILDFITGHPAHATGQIQWSNVTPPAPSGGGGGSLVMRPTALGGIVRARPGGVPILAGEVGENEAVLPLNDSTMGDLASKIVAAAGGTMGAGGSPTFHIYEASNPVSTANSVLRRLNARGAV